MPRYAYVNGRYVPHGEARVHVEDRGYQFADGVYEVVTIRHGRLVDEKGHLDRLGRSLGELRIPWPMSRRSLELVMRALIGKNGVREGLIYLQVTRGVAPRDFKFPKAAAPALVMTTRRTGPAAPREVDGVKVATVPEIRWKRRDIKSVALLPQVLGKQRAAEQGAFEGWQVEEDGTVTEGCSSNAWIVTRDNTVVTRKATTDILNGITRQSLIRLIGEMGYAFEERAFTVEEAYGAKEAFITSASSYALPVTQIDDRIVGNGHPGELTLAIRGAYIDYAEGPGAS